ncbi:hypothetical protein LTR64_001256 [Lithohypha guttulata]|uniref:uncharacterized protein n=1 Tax=Lithohypha guttulata TaxID=1690604 RepID=UPI002DDDC347|nr:hypothetical protein LTR51_003450 [Lithohypha guttulata]
MATVILGGGIIGLSIAYHFSELKPDLAASHQIHVVDSASELLLSASGYAGGFLAKDWFSPASASLGELSFNLHKELAAKHDGARKWGYAPSKVYSLAIDSRGMGKQAKDEHWLQSGTSRSGVAPSSADGATGPGADRHEMVNDDGSPAWFTRQRNGALEVLDDEGNCAQVEPRQLCQWLIERCKERGVQIHTGCIACSIFKNAEGKVAGIKVRKDMEIYEKHAKNIVLAAGAWTPKVFQSIFHDSKFRIPVTPLAGYSIVVRSPRLTKPILDLSQHSGVTPVGISHVIYCNPSPNWAFAPEAFSRLSADGKPEIWIGGLNDAGLQLPDTANGAASLRDKNKSEEMRKAMVAMTGLSRQGDNLQVDDLETKREGLCFRPISRSGYPIISKVPANALGKDIEMEEDGGVFVATGHGPWGISLSLGTGLVMAELLIGRKPSADISRLAIR